MIRKENSVYLTGVSKIYEPRSSVGVLNSVQLLRMSEKLKVESLLVLSNVILQTFVLTNCPLKLMTDFIILLFQNGDVQ